MDLILKDRTYEIIGACYEVHKNLGCGFLEAVYAEALAIEFEARDIPFVQEKILRIKYKSFVLEKRYVADFVCYSSVILELKALCALTSQHEAQVINYLKATRIKLGLLINFGESSLKYRRLIL
jgi:GxxExxY protein